jgi:predicted RNA-binding Zn-ribbon protein involved in translation (DUF1610 family)
MSETKTIHHEYGTTDVEVVECSSCGQEIPKEEAHEFMIKGAQKDVGSITYAGVGSHGWACEHCVETQISFPVICRTLGENTDFADIALVLSLSFFAAWILAIISGVLCTL